MVNPYFKQVLWGASHAVVDCPMKKAQAALAIRSLGSKTSMALVITWEAAVIIAAEVLPIVVSLSIPPPRIKSADCVLCGGISKAAAAVKEVLVEDKDKLRRRLVLAVVVVVDAARLDDGGADHGRFVFLGMAALEAGSASSEASRSQETRVGGIFLYYSVLSIGGLVLQAWLSYVLHF